jgi:hypothetical protein
MGRTRRIGWVVLVGAKFMQMAMRRTVLRESLSYFQTMTERCSAKAASTQDSDEAAYWLGLAQIWSRLAERDE